MSKLLISCGIELQAACSAIGLLDVRGLTKWANIVFEKLARETVCVKRASWAYQICECNIEINFITWLAP